MRELLSLVDRRTWLDAAWLGALLVSFIIGGMSL